MRTIVMCGLLLAIFSVNATAEPKPAEPTAEQLAVARKDYAKFGAAYERHTDPETKQAVHQFVMPEKITDADLKGLPDLPFQFSLVFICAQITDAGLKELKALKNLTVLHLIGMRVTDAGMRQLQELKNLTALCLCNSTFTDAGVRRLKEALPKCKFYGALNE